MKGKLRSMQITLGVHIRNAKGVKFHGLLCCCVYNASLCVCVCVDVSVGCYCRLCVWHVWSEFLQSLWEHINSLTNLNGT